MQWSAFPVLELFDKHTEWASANQIDTSNWKVYISFIFIKNYLIYT